MEGREKAELLPMSSELHPHTHENMATASVESPRTATSVQKMPWGTLCYLSFRSYTFCMWQASCLSATLL